MSGKQSADAEKDRQALYEALALLGSATEAEKFLRDLATPSEVDAFAERWRIARLLNDGAMTYREIAAATGASTTTVARVARFLNDEPHGGYQLLIERLRRGRGAKKGPR